MDIDIRSLAHWAHHQGWTVVVDSRGARFFTPKGVYIVTYPHQPPHPRRRLVDVQAALKSAGLSIPATGPGARRFQRQTG